MAYTYSVQLYSVRSVINDDPLGTLGQLKRMGYSGVEGFGNFVFSAADWKNNLSETGLQIVGYHTPWDFVQDDAIESTIKYYKEIGNKFAIVPALPSDCTGTIDAWKHTAERFNAISKRLQSDGITLGYHNHAKEFQKIDNEIPFFVFFDNTDPSIVMQLDNGNALSGGADLAEIMKRYPGRARSVHLKPWSKEGGFAPVIGQDDINWTEFMHLCRDKGGTGHYIVEYEDDKAHPQMEGVELCIKGLKELEASGKI